MDDANVRITLTQLIQRAAQRDVEKHKKIDLYIAPLGGYLPFDRVPVTEMLEKLDMVEADVSPREGVEFSCNIISSCCAYFRNRELMEAYGCDNPCDLVLKIFDENVGEINNTFAKIMDWYGLSEDYLKN